MSFYRALKANGAVQVSTIPEVVTDVAEGRYQLGITLDSEIRIALKQGSPVVMDWPSDGAISLYSPIAETVAAKGWIDRASAAALRPVAGRADRRSGRPAGSRCCLASRDQRARPGPPRSIRPGPPCSGGRTQVLQQYQAIFGA